MAYIDDKNRAPKVERLPDLRERITRQYDVINFVTKTPAQILADVWLPWGTADVSYPLCILIKQDVGGQLDQPFTNPTQFPPQLIRVYEQLSPTVETQIGNPSTSFDQAGRKTVEIETWQLSGQTPTFGIVGTTIAPSPNTDSVLKTEDRTDDGTLQKIKRVYVNSGEVSYNLETKNNGSLLIQTLVYINEVPPTPAGYVLFSQKIDYPGGLPVYTYSFAKGNGIISTQTEYRRSVDSGATGVTITTIKYLSASSVVVNPITPPGGSATLNTGYEDADGYRIWTGVYATGTGTVDQSIDYKNNGLLVVYSITSLNTPPTTPSSTIGGTVVLIRSSQRNSPRLEEGAIVYDYVWVEGNGLIDDIIVLRNDGLREETYISIGIKQTPAGVVIVSDTAEEDGLPKYTVKCMQNPSGSGPTSGTYTLYRNVPFVYPGRAKPYTKVATDGWTMLDVYLAPPFEASIPGSVIITYQTVPTLQLGSFTRWTPTDWAGLEALWIGPNNYPNSKLQGLRGYRSVSGSTTASVTASNIAGNPGATCLGSPVQGGTTAIITIYGGPVIPDGNAYVLEASLEIAFIGIDGTIYYRQTLVMATIPAQASLPV